MLTSTFCHIPGIGEKTERSIWSDGVMSWDAALQQTDLKLPCSLRQSWVRCLEESISNYTSRNLKYFADKLPSNQGWRLYKDFQGYCAFLDIETTGLYYPAEITTIALYDGRAIRYFVNGYNLNDFTKVIENYQLLVTYNGKCFDIPFIERYFGIRLPQAHIDLRYILRSLDLTGGLKGCERKLGLNRPGLERVDGFIAVLLWNEYRKRKNPKALETLLAYNIQDTVVLQTLMIHAHNEKLKATPFSGSHSLPPPLHPEPPFKADEDTVERILRQAFW
ncbi:MAG TPA: ribonuclease H-like domain-containing protein [Thermodesulfobacteriota bacterium]|nr:ribonuclease H-like domain-containing protein [Thermodesulfobacteriota bacterium]